VNTPTFVALLNVFALVTIMLAMGLQVKFQAVTGSVRPAHRVALGMLANYVLVPAVTVLLLYLFGAQPLVSAGFLILAVCPGAPFGPLATTIARGNVAWSISAMVILAGFSAVLSPALLGILLAWITPGSNLSIDYLAIARTLLLAQLLPLAVGLTIHHYLPTLTDKVVKPISLAANVMLLVLIVLILATQYQTLAAIGLRGWTGMGLLFFASLGIGWACGGTDVSIRKALAVTTAGRNAAVGLVIVTSNFTGTEAVTAVVAYALVSIVGTLGVAMALAKMAVAKD
jgi:BASS family bile acid:Na+ symporter